MDASVVNEKEVELAVGQDRHPESVDDIVNLVKSLGCTKDYSEVIRANEIDADVFGSLTSAEIREELRGNLKDRRKLLEAVAKVSTQAAIPEHGRILSHLSNVRTYHSWVRLGLHLLALGCALSRLMPDKQPLATVAGTLFACFGPLAMWYGKRRYAAVAQMIETPDANYTADFYGVESFFFLVLVLVSFGIAVIARTGMEPDKW